MTLKEFGECIEFNIEHDIKHAILGLGAPGIGKSQLIKEIGEKYGMKVIDIRLAQMSEVEIGGLIYPNEERTKTRWLAPEILPDEERDGKKTILLLDEITSCPKRVQVAAYQLILDRRVGQYTLPEGTVVIALGNREDDDGIYIQLAAPLADRFEIHNIDISYDCWREDFAKPMNVHPYIIKYLDYKPQALHTQENSGGSLLFATPRSWTRVSEVLNYDSNVSNPVVRRKIIGNIGESEGFQFIDFVLNNRGRVTADEFLLGMPSPTLPEEVMVLIGALAEKVKFVSAFSSLSQLNKERRTLLEAVISAMFRLSNSEYTLIGLKKLTELNCEMIRQVFALMDNSEIVEFVRKNDYSSPAC